MNTTTNDNSPEYLLRNSHRILASEILDRLAAAEVKGLSTKDLSHMMTSWARRQGDDFIGSIGSYNALSGGYWEITGAQIGRILRKLASSDARIVQTHGQSVAVFRWQPTLDAETARQERLAEAVKDIEVQDRSDWDIPYFMVVRKHELPNPLQPGSPSTHWNELARFWVHLPAVDRVAVPEYLLRLSVDEARSAAEATAALLRKQIAKTL